MQFLRSLWRFIRNVYPLAAVFVAALIVGIGICGFDIPEGGGRRELLLLGALLAGAAVFYLLKPGKSLNDKAGE